MKGMNINIYRNIQLKTTVTACAVFLLFFTFQNVAMAWADTLAEDKNFNWPDFDRSAPLKREFTVVKHYNLVIREFSPPVVIEQLTTPIILDKVLYPEQTIRNHISAMRAGDYDWWLSSMDKIAREAVQAADEKNNFVEKRKEQWTAIMEGSVATMERWIETGRYLIITVRLHSTNNKNIPSEGIEIPLVLDVREGTWLITSKLRTDDPVYQNFNHPDFKEKGEVVIKRTIK